MAERTNITGHRTEPLLVSLHRYRAQACHAGGCGSFRRHLFVTTSIAALGLAWATTTAGAQTAWTGNTSTDWFIGTNWTSGVPTSSVDAKIDTTSPNPTVIGAAGAQAQNSNIGYAVGSTGTVTVTGGGSTWTNSGDLTVGLHGSGTLTIQNGGSVGNVTGFVGNNAGGSSSVTVDSGGVWSNSNNLYVANFGAGTLTIKGAGKVNNVTGTVGSAAGSNGTVTVTGTGSTWTNSGDLSVGSAGTGTLMISGGASVSSVNGNVGDFSGSNGTVTVTGTGSTWTNTGDLFVGNVGTGALTIAGGGSVSNTHGYVGNSAGTSGSVTVNGANSVWANSSILSVGQGGTGALTISGGGSVSNTSGYVGEQSGSTGAVTVDGNGSTWVNSGVLNVGNGGTGTLTISGGGAVSNTNNGYVGYLSGSTGTVTVTGANSTWTNTGNLIVGSLGNATLAIKSGGLVSDVVGQIGAGAGSSGTVTVNGIGSSWTDSGNLVVGDAGTGTLTISNGGNVSATSVTIANQAGSTGTLNIGAASGQAAVAPGTLNAATVALGGATASIVFNHTASNYVFASTILGGGSVTVEAGTTALAGTNIYTGATNINGGVLQISADHNLGAGSALLNFDGGTLATTANINSARTVTLNAGGGTFDVASSTALTMWGVIGGIGALTKTDNGTLTLIGANTYTGATTVNAGKLAAGAANTLSAASATTINAGGTLDLGGLAQTVNTLSLAGGTLQNGALTGSVTSTGGTINGLNGSASVTTTAGTTIVLGTDGYAGATRVNGGTLQVDGKITGTLSVAVNSGGILTGIGIIDPLTVTINSGGTFAPGNGTPGTSTKIAGNLAFASGATYLIQLNPSTASFANVTGTATLGGATVNAAFSTGTYVAKQYTILTTTGGINGAFSGPVNTNLPLGFKTSLSYDANDAYLDLAIGFVPPPGSGFSGNQQNVGNAITNFFSSQGSIPLVFGGLTPGGLTQLSGEGATGSQQTTFGAMNQFMGVLIDPFIAGRGEPIAAGGSPLGYAEQTASKRSDAFAMFTKTPIASTYEPRWSVWAAGFGGSQTTDGNATVGSNTATSRIFGTAVGADYQISPNTLAGFALAGGGTNFSVNALGSGTSDLFQAGAYLRHTNGAAYISGALAYGWQDITTDRTVTVAGVDRLRAEFKANAWSGRLEGGYRFVAPWIGGIGITPYAAAQFTSFGLPAYAEQVVSGASTFALAYGAKTATDSRGELGLRTDKSFAAENGLLTLRSRFAWAHDFNPDHSVAATFQTLPGASFVVNGAAMASDSALVTASAERKWLNGWSAAATFEGEFSNVTRSYAGKGVVRYQW